MRKSSEKKHIALSRIFHRINKEVTRFKEVEFFHVLRMYNWLANKLANEASRHEYGSFRDKSALSRFPIS
jgi:hypothetical protein